MEDGRRNAVDPSAFEFVAPAGQDPFKLDTFELTRFIKLARLLLRWRFQNDARRHSAILSARAKFCPLAQAIEQFCPSPLNPLAAAIRRRAYGLSPASTDLF